MNRSKHVGTGMRTMENALKERKAGTYVLHLYVAGMSPQSQKAIENVRKLCEEHLKGHYELAIHDIYKHPIIAREGQILAAPTLVKELPLPLRKFVGGMSDTDKLLVGLDLRSKV